jgi:hypothetical protein
METLVVVTIGLSAKIAVALTPIVTKRTSYLRKGDGSNYGLPKDIRLDN